MMKIFIKIKVTKKGYTMEVNRINLMKINLTLKKIQIYKVTKIQV